MAPSAPSNLSRNIEENQSSEPNTQPSNGNESVQMNQESEESPLDEGWYELDLIISSSNSENGYVYAVAQNNTNKTLLSVNISIYLPDVPEKGKHRTVHYGGLSDILKPGDYAIFAFDVMSHFDLDQWDGNYEIKGAPSSLDANKDEEIKEFARTNFHNIQTTRVQDYWFDDDGHYLHFTFEKPNNNMSNRVLSIGVDVQGDLFAIQQIHASKVNCSEDHCEYKINTHNDEDFWGNIDTEKVSTIYWYLGYYD